MSKPRPKSILSNPAQLKPGQLALRSGAYHIIGPRGGKAPRTPIAGSQYKLVRAEKNKAGFGK